MKWFRPASLYEIENMRNQNVIQENQPFRIEIRPASDALITEMGVIAQMYIAPFEFVTEQTCIQLPVGHQMALDEARQQLAIHFKNYKEVVIDGKVVHLVLSELRDESAAYFKNLHEQGKLSPQVTDVFRSKVVDFDPLKELLGTKDVYKLDTKMLRGQPDEESKNLWEFIRATTLEAEGHATFSPVGWKFHEELLDSVFLSGLSRVCEDIYLIVDRKSNEVRTISGSRSVSAHPRLP